VATEKIENIDYRVENLILAEHWWFTPIILATQEAEITKIAVLS
jgi:hypothetical protein